MPETLFLSAPAFAHPLLVAASAGTVLAVAAGALLVASRARRRRARRLARLMTLAREIAAVADEIHTDLRDVLTDSSVRLLQDAVRCRVRADRALRSIDELRTAPWNLLNRGLERLHHEHRRVVSLRLQADKVLAGEFHPLNMRSSRSAHTVRLVTRRRGQQCVWSATPQPSSPSTLA